MLADVEDKTKLLESFIEQSKRDADELASAIDVCDRKRLRAIVHRMLPMWELLKQDETLLTYRLLLKDSATDDNAIREHTQQIVKCNAMLIAEANNEIKRLDNEKENIDC